MQKEIQARYQGSLLGLLWSYVQPLVRFCMYFFVIGLVLGLHKTVPNFAIHMFAALIGVHFFTETFSSGTRSIVRNKAIVRKMAMPREMFPVAVGDRLGDQLVPAAADPLRRRGRGGLAPRPAGASAPACSASRSSPCSAPPWRCCSRR